MVREAPAVLTCSFSVSVPSRRRACWSASFTKFRRHVPTAVSGTPGSSEFFDGVDLQASRAADQEAEPPQLWRFRRLRQGRKRPLLPSTPTRQDHHAKMPTSAIRETRPTGPRLLLRSVRSALRGCRRGLCRHRCPLSSVAQRKPAHRRGRHDSDVLGCRVHARHFHDAAHAMLNTTDSLARDSGR